MALVSLSEISFSYGGGPLLEKVGLQIERGERIGLVGRNGSGKSTLMKLISGELSADNGQIVRGPGVRISRLIQEVPSGSDSSVQEVVATGLGPAGEVLATFFALSREISESSSPSAELIAKLQAAEQTLHGHGVGWDSVPTVPLVGTESQPTKTSVIGVSGDHPPAAWELEHQVERILAQMNLDPHASFATLSSGMKRRVLLAQALVCQPDLLLLDEPTNHLDIEAVAWLEEFLARYGGTLIFVTHDRAFLRKLSTRIIEVDRGRLLDWPCDYSTFLERRDAALEVEAQQQAQFDKKLAQEEVWVRTGVKARRTRNEARVRELLKLREERRQRKQRVGNVRLQVQEAERSGRLVIEAKQISFRYEPVDDVADAAGFRSDADSVGRDVLREFSTLILRGDKIGVIGRNGSGKSTLLRLLLGQLTPTTGTLRLGTKLEVAYFDQLREQLDENKTAQENVSEGKELLLINGQNRHIVGYLQDFLFSPARARTLVKYLSGGERNRLMLAKLLTRPSNVLVLDEPTNDLDAETLELLEELLTEYPGTVLLVSHDREFLNNVVTSTFVLEGDGLVKEYDGGYDDWLRQRAGPTPLATKTSTEASVRSPRPGTPGRGLRRGEPAESATGPSTSGSQRQTSGPLAAGRGVAPRKLSFKEQRELESLPARIERLETEQQALHATMSAPAFYQQSKSDIAAATAKLEALERDLAESFTRWESLEPRAATRN